MDSFKETAQACVEEISTVISCTKEEELAAIAQGFKHARRIFISGDGRSGLMGQSNCYAFNAWRLRGVRRRRNDYTKHW